MPSIFDTIRRRLRLNTPPGMMLAEGSGPRRVKLAGDRAITYDLLYETQPVVAAVVNKLARQISTLPLRVYREAPNGSLEQVRRHPLVDVLKSPAPRYGQHNLVQWIALPALVFGNALIAIVRTGSGVPMGLLPMDWRYVNAYAPGIAEPIKLWSTIQTGTELFVAPEDVVHFYWQGSRGFVGVSPLTQLADTLRVEDAARRYQIANFERGVRPSGVLTMENLEVDDAKRERMREQLKSLHEGVDQTGRLLILGGGMRFERMSHTAVEAELISQRKLSREEVEMVYDVAPPLIGDLEHGTYSNVEELYRQLYRTAIRPWLWMIESTLKAQLIDPTPEWRDLRVRFDLTEVERASLPETVTALTEAVQNGIMTIDEARELLALNPFDTPNTTKPLVQANNTRPLDATGRELPAGDPPADQPTNP